jgi:tetratricopeptide (TPR) repeat protein
MNPTRIEILKKYLQEDPHDPFPVYALALEYQATDPEKARQLFEDLLTKHPEYLPTYYMAGNFFIVQNEVERAIAILQHGLALAKAQKNSGTVREIQGMLDGL